MRINDHFHSRCSFDGEHSLTEMCRAAEAAGLQYLCLTDHCDLVDEYGNPYDSFDWAAVNRELEEARRDCPHMPVRRGIELGQAVLRPEAAERVLSEPGIDFVLGSMHVHPGGEDYYWMKYTSLAQCEALLETYLESLLALSRSDWMDSLAHLTYPIRYMRFRDGIPVELHPFDDLIREILKTLVERGKALELNTSGYRQGMGEPLPPAYVLRMYRELGGELLTIGTDAHVPQDMAAGLDRGQALLEQCGFRYVTIYQQRKPIQMKLEDVR